MYSSENSIKTKVSSLALHQKAWNDTGPKVSELEPSPAKICKNTEFKSQRSCCLVMLKTLQHIDYWLNSVTSPKKTASKKHLFWMHCAAVFPDWNRTGKFRTEAPAWRPNQPTSLRLSPSPPSLPSAHGWPHWCCEQHAQTADPTSWPQWYLKFSLKRRSSTFSILHRLLFRCDASSPSPVKPKAAAGRYWLARHKINTYHMCARARTCAYLVAETGAGMQFFENQRFTAYFKYSKSLFQLWTEKSDLQCSQSEAESLSRYLYAQGSLKKNKQKHPRTSVYNHQVNQQNTCERVAEWRKHWCKKEPWTKKIKGCHLKKK